MEAAKAGADTAAANLESKANGELGVYLGNIVKQTENDAQLAASLANDDEAAKQRAESLLAASLVNNRSTGDDFCAKPEAVNLPENHPVRAHL